MRQVGEEYSEEDIESAMSLVARVIELYGDVYWPIFDRLECELDLRRQRSARLSASLAKYASRKPGRTDARRRLN